jgi:hypothetical protein
MGHRSAIEIEDEQDAIRERDCQRVVAVALFREGVIVTKPAPARHHHLVSELNFLGVNPNDWMQGFLSDRGEYLSRFQARQAVLNSGQLTKTRNPSELFSEDLW